MQERLRYSPLGWSKKYEFTDSDLKCGCDLLDTWIDSTSKGRSNLPPEKIPWDAMRTTLAKCIYGGKIDNDFDQQLLNAFLSNLFTIKSFEADFALIDDSDGKGTPILMPDGLRWVCLIFMLFNSRPRSQPAIIALLFSCNSKNLNCIGALSFFKIYSHIF